MSTRANARVPNINRAVYAVVADNLAGNGPQPGYFDLMNKGVTILAEAVRIIDAKHHVLQVIVPPDDDHFGICDGAHTMALIAEGNTSAAVHPDQHVWLTIMTGVPPDATSLVAQGLNTGIKVAPHSIYNLEGAFGWLKEEMDNLGFLSLIRWRESDKAEYDVRELIGILECFNIFDFPNEDSRHPIQAYEKYSIPLDHFHKDFAEYEQDISKSKYHRLRPLLADALTLYDHIRHDFRLIYNSQGGKGRGGSLGIMQSRPKGKFVFPFADLTPESYRLTKGCLYPILAAFRNYVEIGSKREARWVGGFDEVKNIWLNWGARDLALRLVSTVVEASTRVGSPDHVGKDRNLWANLHSQVALHLARSRK